MFGLSGDFALEERVSMVRALVSDPPGFAAQRRDKLVICGPALLRYLPEALRVLLGHSGRSSSEPPTAVLHW